MSASTACKTPNEKISIVAKPRTPIRSNLDYDMTSNSGVVISKDRLSLSKNSDKSSKVFYPKLKIKNRNCRLPVFDDSSAGVAYKTKG